MWDKLKQIKKWVIDNVLWAERELKGKSGAEKRAIVVQRLDDLIPLPFYLEWADGPLIGWLVDLACKKLNSLSDKDDDFSAVELNEEQKEELAEVLTMEVNDAEVKQGKTVDERLDALYKQYGVEAEPSLLLAPIAEALTLETGKDEPTMAKNTAKKDEQLTPHFKRSEFACKCGCGKDNIDPVLVNHCETIRMAAGVALLVNSGVRCDKHNAKVGGVKGSYHTQGKAADIKCSLGARKLYELIQALYAAGKLPGLEYCLKYPTFVHIDIGKKRNQRFAVRG